ncbi:hypothetical protein VTK73DRAFT_6072 [Phialemonium thermophilum]|uniref:Uncharacterized protein n=1 Tax=Phialemonium thermophilum TaxID=223376 RepID=A0ABR3V077_9PEZI
MATTWSVWRKAQLQLVEDAAGRGGDVDLLDGDVLGAAAARELGGVGLARLAAVPLQGRGGPPLVLLVQVPRVVVVVVLQVLRLVDGGEGACRG